MTLAERIAEKVAAKAVLADTQDAVLAENDNYVNYLADRQVESDQVTKLDVIISKLNAMKAIIATDGTKYGVNCYSVAESIFGPIGSRLMAIATIAGAMFTTERQSEFTALTGVPYLIALDAAHQLGRPAYTTRAGVYVEEFIYSADKYAVALTAVAHSLGLDVIYANQVTVDKLDRWFQSSKAKELTKVVGHKKSDSIEDEPFTLED